MMLYLLGGTISIPFIILFFFKSTFLLMFQINQVSFFPVYAKVYGHSFHQWWHTVYQEQASIFIKAKATVMTRRPEDQTTSR